MKVADIMRKDVDFVTTKTSAKDVAHLIFGQNINGIPVCRGRKIVGFITERDIVAQFFPSMQEYVEDPVHARDFEGMEKKVNEILDLPAAKIMSTQLIVVTPDTPVLKAHSLMALHKVGRLPVVDKKGNFMGLIAKVDIFRSVVGEKIPLGEEEKFYDWLARHYDILVDWNKRLSAEIPDLMKLLKREKAYRILDVGSATGEHSIALAKKGFVVWGLEISMLMNEIAEKKKQKLPSYIAGKITFLGGNYKEIIKKSSEEFDAAIFMGNALCHTMITDIQILKRIEKVLHLKNSLIVLQIGNFHKYLKLQRGLRRFNFRKTHLAYEQAHIFLGFYSKMQKPLIYNLAIFDYAGGQWIFQGLNSTPMKDVGRSETAGLLKKFGFSDITFYGGMAEGPLFAHSFDPVKHDWLNVVARR